MHHPRIHHSNGSLADVAVSQRLNFSPFCWHCILDKTKHLAFKCWHVRNKIILLKKDVMVHTCICDYEVFTVKELDCISLGGWSWPGENLKKTSQFFFSCQFPITFTII